MSGNFIKDDLRIIKTQRSIQEAFSSLLKKRNFRNITVNNLCEEAYISRSAFYAHFKDKYDLLGYWISASISNFPEDIHSILNVIVYTDQKIIKNIIEDADAETLDILYSSANTYLSSMLEISDIKKNTAEYIVFSNFCTGGVIHHLMWQVKNKYPPSAQNTKDYFHDLINCLIQWDKHRNKA